MESVSEVRRRTFLQMLGGASAATIIGLPDIARAASSPDIVETALRLSVQTRGGDAMGFTQPMHPTVFRLLAPAGRRCRATIFPALPDAVPTKIMGMVGCNGAAEIVVTKMGDFPAHDAVIFNTPECFVPVDLSTREDCPLVVEFEAAGERSHLLLLLWHTTDDGARPAPSWTEIIAGTALDGEPASWGPFRHILEED